MENYYKNWDGGIILNRRVVCISTLTMHVVDLGGWVFAKKNGEERTKRKKNIHNAHGPILSQPNRSDEKQSEKIGRRGLYEGGAPGKKKIESRRGH